jgi:hypothetical protein
MGSIITNDARTAAGKAAFMKKKKNLFSRKLE